MILRSNVHTHTTWCDGNNTPDEMARAALALGFTDLGFSSHFPTPFDPTCPGVSDETAYIREITQLKQRYAGRLGILCGIELDLYAPVDHRQYDYTIGSSHYLPPQQGRHYSVDNTHGMLQEAIDRQYGGSGLAMARDYYAGVVRLVREQRPTIVGHYDLIKKYNAGNSLFDEESGAYQTVALEALDIILDLLEDYGGMVEINTGAMARGLRRDPYPAPYLLRHIAQRGGSVIISSDSHQAATLNAGFEKALGMAQKAGFTQVMLLENGRFQPKAIP